MIPESNVPYVRASVMTLCIVIGITLSGLARLFVPGAVASSSALQSLPTWVVIYINFAWASSGIVTTVGILSGRRNIEGAGLVLITAAFLSYFLAILAFKPDTAPAAIYVLAFALGAGLRARYVVGDRWLPAIVERVPRHPRA